MKHIYIVDEHQSSKQNGIGTYIRQLLKCFEDSGHDVNLLSFNSDVKEFQILMTGTIRVFHIPICMKGNFLNHGALSLAMLKLYIEDSIDNIFFVNHFPCSLFLKNLRKLFTYSRLIFVVHDQCWCASLLGDSEALQTVKRQSHLQRSLREERKGYMLVDDIIALSYTTYNLLKSFYHIPTNKLHIIPNGISIRQVENCDTEKRQLRKDLGIAEYDIILLYAGRMAQSKGVIELLQAFELLWKENTNLRLVMAGQVFELERFTKQTPKSLSHIVYTGLISQEQLQKWYMVADIGILPSYTEQCSYTGIEMLGYGKLIIATDGHNLKDMFNNENSIIAHIDRQALNPQQGLAQQIYIGVSNLLSMNEEAKHKLRNNALNQYNQLYALKHMRKAYLQLTEKERRRYNN